MRFLIIRKADAETEAEKMPSEELIRQMTEYNEAMAKAGVLVTGEGLRASRQGARVKFRGGKPNVIDGPFAESKELIAGFSIIEVPSRDEAIAWVKKWPQLDGHGEVEIEIRQIFEAADFGEAFTPELQQREQAMRSAQAAKAKA